MQKLRLYFARVKCKIDCNSMIYAERYSKIDTEFYLPIGLPLDALSASFYAKSAKIFKM